MKWFAETTAWKGVAPNHVYLLDDAKSKMFAYVPQGAKNPVVFRAPIRIDIRGRKFKINLCSSRLRSGHPSPKAVCGRSKAARVISTRSLKCAVSMLAPVQDSVSVAIANM